MAQTLITPTTEVFPPGAGTCTPTAGQAGPIPGWTSGGSERQPYTYTAAAAAGYRFVRFEIRTVVRYVSGGATQDDTVDGISWDNPHTSGEYYGGTVWWRDWSNYDDDYEYTLSVHVKAVFEPAHDPTHLLVFDDRSGGSGLLVFDDRPGGSGLLVGDY